MSKTSKILATASALMLAITAAGCGSSEKSSSEKEDTTASKEVEPAGSVENAKAEGTDKSDVDIANEFKEQLNDGMTEPASITTEAGSEKPGVGQQVADLDEESKRLIEELSSESRWKRTLRDIVEIQAVLKLQQVYLELQQLQKLDLHE